MSLHTEISSLVTDAVDAAGDAVVTLGRGCGVIVAPGRVVTNAHNLTTDAPDVAFADGRRDTAATLGVDLAGDLAVLAVDTGELSPAPLAAEPAGLGDVVVALARPRGRGLVASVGTVTTVGARFRGPRGTPVDDAVEHDARLPRGGSGGPVVDADGQVTALSTHRRRDGFYAALPVTPALRDRIDALGRGETPDRPRLGVTVAPPEVARRLRRAVGLSDRDGVLVRDVDPEGAAARAGIEEGDLITHVDGTPLATVDDLHDHLAGRAADPLHLSVVRGEQEREVVVHPTEPRTA